MQETKQTLYELLAGVVLCFLLFLLGNIFVSNRLAYTLGLLLGNTIAGIMSVHMYRSLEQAMLYDEKTESNCTKFNDDIPNQYIDVSTNFPVPLLGS